MKKIIYLLIGMVILLPNIVFASSTYNEGVNKVNTYIYDFNDYARYIKLGGNIPFDITGNKPSVNSLFVSGGFLNEAEYNRSVNGSTSYLSPGIGYWLTGNKILDVSVSGVQPNTATSGVRVTEFVKHGVKVKGSGTKTNPWKFADGYIVKVTSSDQSLGTVVGNCEHIPEGGSCTFTITYDTNHGMNIDNCRKVVESKGATLNLNGNILTINNVKSDISCFVDFGTNSKCLTVSFDNNGGSGGMANTSIYYKYGYGWFSDALCLNKVTNVTKPTRAGYSFTGYKYNNRNLIDTTPKIVFGVREEIDRNITATASWTPNIYTVSLNRQSGSGGTDTIYQKYNTGWYSNSNATTSISSITRPYRDGYGFGGYYTSTNGGGTNVINSSGSIVGGTTLFTSNGELYAKWTQCSAGYYANSSTIVCQPCAIGKYSNAGASSCFNAVYTVNFNKDGGKNGSNSVSATYGMPMPAITIPNHDPCYYRYTGVSDCGNGDGSVCEHTWKIWCGSYVFLGYYLGNTKYYNADGSSARNWDKTEGATLTAKWQLRS